MYVDMWIDLFKRLSLDEKCRHPAMEGLAGAPPPELCTTLDEKRIIIHILVSSLQQFDRESTEVNLSMT
jgi:hypothetical protein